MTYTRTKKAVDAETPNPGEAGVRARAGHGIEAVCGYGRVLGTASGWFAGADACRVRLAVRVVCGEKGRVARAGSK